MENHNCFNKQLVVINDENEVNIRIIKNNGVWVLELSQGKANDECWVLETPISYCPYCKLKLA